MHISFALVKNKSCFKDIGTIHCMKTEFFHAILIITIGLLKFRNKSTDVQGFFKGALKRFFREIFAFV